MLLRMSGRENISNCLVSALKILLDGNMILDLEENNRGSKDKSGSEEGPVGDELSLERQLASIEIIDYSGTNGLDALVKSNVVGRATTGVG